MERKNLAELKGYVDTLPGTLSEGQKVSPKEKGLKMIDKAKIQIAYIDDLENNGIKSGITLDNHRKELSKILAWEYGSTGQKSEYADKIKSVFGSDKPAKGTIRYEKTVSIYSDKELSEADLKEKLGSIGLSFLLTGDSFRPSVIFKNETYGNGGKRIPIEGKTDKYEYPDIGIIQEGNKITVNRDL